jgi:hypothetical protein
MIGIYIAARDPLLGSILGLSGKRGREAFGKDIGRDIGKGLGEELCCTMAYDNYKRGMEGRKCRCMYIYANRKAAIHVHY